MPLVRKRPKRKPRLPKPPNLIGNQSRYLASINVLLDVYQRMVWDELTNIIPSITNRQDDDSDFISSAFNRIRDQLDLNIPKSSYERTAIDAAVTVNRANKGYYEELTSRVLGVNPLQHEPWLNESMKLFVRENASLIQTLPTEGLSDIEQMVYRESRRGLSPKDMRAKIREEFEVTEGRARVIARDQVGKFNANLTEKRQTNLGITEYIWRDSGDGRVRSQSNTKGYSDHSHLDGTKQKWSDPPVTVFKGKRAGERNHPGEDIQCRCWADPVIDHLL